jgi:hypothetical protein
MIEFSNQGEILTTGTVLLIGSKQDILKDKILGIRFNNPLAYSIKLYRYDYATATTVVLYNLNLSAGDTLTDDLTYALNYGDEIIAFSDIPGTAYYTHGQIF